MGFWESISKVAVPFYGAYSALQSTKKSPVPIRKESAEHRLRRRVAEYDRLAAKTTKNLQSQFNRASNLATAGQLRGIGRDVGQAIARRGLDSSALAGTLENSAISQLRAQAQQQQASFSSSLATAMARDRQALIRGEFSFMNQMDYLSKRYDLEKDLARLRNKFNEDAQLRQAWFDTAQSAGTALAFL